MFICQRTNHWLKIGPIFEGHFCAATVLYILCCICIEVLFVLDRPDSRRPISKKTIPAFFVTIRDE